MIKKRLIGVVTVKDGWAVQSFGYKRYLPLGRPEVLVQNLDRWGADEIMLQCIDRSRPDRGDVGPDFALLDRVAKLGIATPLIYAGGVRTADDARVAVNMGADRIALDAMLRDDAQEVAKVGYQLGAQAVIAALPMTATDLPVRFSGTCGLTQPSSKPRSMIAHSIDLIVTGSSTMLSVQAASHGAGQTRPVNSGKLLVECSTSSAFFQSSSYTRWFQSGMMLFTGQPL